MGRKNYPRKVKDRKKKIARSVESEVKAPVVPEKPKLKGRSALGIQPLWKRKLGEALRKRREKL